jgi:hypothetical protein
VLPQEILRKFFHFRALSGDFRDLGNVEIMTQQDANGRIAFDNIPDLQEMELIVSPDLNFTEELRALNSLEAILIVLRWFCVQNAGPFFCESGVVFGR